MPRFSIVIPTLRRPDTFAHALATARAQTFDDFEVVVQNNGGDPAIAAIVDKCADPRIRHFWSQDILTMSHNWETALANATGEYITFIGDDDGLYPDACELANSVIETTSLEIVSWIVGSSYYWPNYLHADLGNRLIATIDYDCRIDLVRSGDELNKLYRFATSYARLPMIYNSFVRRSVVDRVRAAAGCYFIGYAPDVISGIANAAFTDHFARLTPPLSLTGTSHHSIGHNQFASPPGYFPATQVQRDFGKFTFHDQLVPADSLQMFIANDMLTAKERLFPHRRIDLDYEGLVAHLAANINDRPGHYDETLAAIRQLAKCHDVDMNAVSVPAELKERKPARAGGVHDKGSRVYFVVDGNEIGLANVHDAVRLMMQLRPAVGSKNLDVHTDTSAAVAISGKMLAFNTKGTGLPALRIGWADPEPWGTWSVAKNASLAFSFEDTPSGATAQLDFRANIMPAHSQIEVSCAAKGNIVGRWTCSLNVPVSSATMTIPRDAFEDDGTLLLDFTISEPRSPAELGLSQDTRLLGIGVEKIVFQLN